MEQFVVKDNTKSAKGLRVLMKNRPNALVQRGGDTLVMEKTAQALQQSGVEVVIDLQGQVDPAQFDLLHLFNFALPDLLRAQAEKAEQVGVPFVVTSLCEDVPNFHNQSHAYSSALIQYVHSGQNRQWWQSQEPYLMQVGRCARFNNDWVAQRAAALLSSGSGESKVLRRDYPKAGQIVDVPFGFQSVGQADAELFVNKYGVRDFVFCVGRLESRKNQLMLLKALEDSELTVVLAGGDFSYQPDYAAAVSGFKRRGKTVVLKWLTPDELASAYQAARLHALPSWYELPGLVSIESARQGRNIVATDTGSTRDYLGDAAFYCKPNDEQSIFNAVMAAYYAPKRDGLEDLPTQYTWERTARETIKVYHQVLGIVSEVETEGTSLKIPSCTTGSISINSGSNNDFDQILESAEKAAQERDFEGATQLFQQAQAINPASVRAIRGMGAVSLAQDHLQDALSSFEQALRREPNDAKTLSGLGMVQIRLGQSSLAYSYLTRALEIDPYQLVTILQLVECSYALGRYDQLERVLRNYLAERPDDLNMHFCLAGCLFKNGKIDEAARLNDTVLKEQPLHTGAVELRIQISKKRQEQAASQELTIIKENRGVDSALTAKAGGIRKDEEPSNSQRYDSLADSHPNNIEQKLANLEEEKAKRNYERVLEESKAILEKCSVNPAQRERLLLLQAESSILAGDLAGAEIVYNTILQVNPNSCRGLCGQAVLAAERNNWTEAERLFNQAHGIEANNDLALAGLGMCQRRSGANDRAWHYYDLAQKKNPENMRALLGLIELAYPLKRCSELEDALQRYLDMHPADLDFVYALAGCYYAQEKLEQAAAELDKITLFNPTHEKACELKGIIQQRQSGEAVGERF